MEYLSADKFYKNFFGQKVYRISINLNMSCPNRDGTKGVGGCIFCSEGGSGEFAPSKFLSIKEQILIGKNIAQNKSKCTKFIAYFQSFSNTYSDVKTLEKLYSEALFEEDIVALSIATRPDCLSEKIVNLLNKLNKIKPIFVELGLQTIHEKTANFINRCYDLSVYDNAIKMLKNADIMIITHIIFGLPNETKSMMLETVKYVCKDNIHGVKFTVLYVPKNSRLAKVYEENPFHIMSLEEYADLLIEAIKIVPKSMVIHRITGDPPKKFLLKPTWTSDKKKVLNYLRRRIDEAS